MAHSSRWPSGSSSWPAITGASCPLRIAFLITLLPSAALPLLCLLDFEPDAPIVSTLPAHVLLRGCLSGQGSVWALHTTSVRPSSEQQLLVPICSCIMRVGGDLCIDAAEVR